MTQLQLVDLDQYAAVPFPRDFPHNQRAFYSPVDRVHLVLRDCVASAESELIVAMYGYDDKELHNIIRDHMKNPNIFVQLSLDSTQAGGVHESQLLKEWLDPDNPTPATILSIGNSGHGGIEHDKLAVVDGLLTISGSTNWSISGETKQDNQLTVTRDRPFADRARHNVQLIHAEQVAKMLRRQHRAEQSKAA